MLRRLRKSNPSLRRPLTKGQAVAFRRPFLGQWLSYQQRVSSGANFSISTCKRKHREVRSVSFHKQSNAAVPKCHVRSESRRITRSPRNDPTGQGTVPNVEPPCHFWLSNIGAPQCTSRPPSYDLAICRAMSPTPSGIKRGALRAGVFGQRRGLRSHPPY